MRTPDWVKIKSWLSQSCVIAGYTAGRGRRTSQLGALILAVLDGTRLVHCGQVGTGFDEKTLRDLRERLRPLEVNTCPLDVTPKTSEPATWVKPELVCEVRFAGWTRDGILRHPAFRTLRPDQRPEDCIREAFLKTEPADGPTPSRAAVRAGNTPPIADATPSEKSAREGGTQAQQSARPRPSTGPSHAAPAKAPRPPREGAAATPRTKRRAQGVQTPAMAHRPPGGAVGSSATGGPGSEDASPTRKDDKPQETRPAGGEGPPPRQDPEDLQALAQLRTLKGNAHWEIAGRRLPLTNLDKVLWPADGITKRDMIEYYVRMAPYMLPYLRDRPLSMQVFPDGIDGKSFWRKDKPAHAPTWIESWTYHGREDQDVHRRQRGRDARVGGQRGGHRSAPVAFADRRAQ